MSLKKMILAFFIPFFAIPFVMFGLVWAAQMPLYYVVMILLAWGLFAGKSRPFSVGLFLFTYLMLSA